MFQADAQDPAKLDVLSALQNQKQQLAREIEERKQAKEQLQHLNGVLHAIRGINQLSIREKQQDRLIQGACDHLVQARGYLNAWVAILDHPTGVTLTAQAGLGEAFEPMTHILEQGQLPPCGQRALAQPGIVIVEVSPTNCQECPLRLAHGPRTAIVTRLEHGGTVYGLLSIALSPDLVADDEEKSLLIGVAGDIAFALHSMEVERARQQAEAERNNRVRELACLYDTSNDLQQDLALEELGQRTVDRLAQAMQFAADSTALLELEGRRFSSGVYPAEPWHSLEAEIQFAGVCLGRVAVYAPQDKPFLLPNEQDILDSTANFFARWHWRKQAEHALQRRATQFGLVNDVGRLIAGVLDLPSALDRAARLVHETFGYHHVALFTLDRSRGELALRARAGEFAAYLPADQRLKLGQGMVGWVGEHGRTLLANDVEKEPRYANPYSNRLPTRSELSVPIWIGDDLVGVLDIQSAQPGAFDEVDVQVMGTLASQVAVAIDNARLYADIRRRNRELTLLNQITAAAAAEQDIDSILQVACRELALALYVPQVAAFLINSRQTGAVVAAEYVAADGPSVLGEAFSLEGTVSEHFLQYQAPLLVNNAQTDPRLAPARELMRRRGSVALLLLPFFVEGQVAGSLAVDLVESRSLTAEEIAMAQRATEQVSAALARAYLWEQHELLEEQLRQAQKMEAVGRLAGGIAHDFNNLLTVIHLSTRLLERELRPDDPLWAHVQRIQETGQWASRLTKQLLAFSRRDIIAPQVMNLNDLIGELSKMLQRLISEDIELTTILAEDLWPVHLDLSQMEQLILNLVVNARDAMPAGGKLTIETANTVLDRAYANRHMDVEPGEYVQLAISDTGQGMNEETKAHIFEPFFTTKEQGKGTGLGLATVFGIVKQNRGHIWVYSEAGRGSTFKIYLPRHAPAGAQPASRPSAQAETSQMHSQETILLVEDDAGVRDVAVQILEEYGYRILMAQDGEKALHIAAQHQGPVHLLLTDVVMPHMSGRDLANRLRAIWPQLRVLYMSGYTDNTIVHHGVLEPGIAFVAKPLTLESLVGKVRAVLNDEI